VPPAGPGPLGPIGPDALGYDRAATVSGSTAPSSNLPMSPGAAAQLTGDSVSGILSRLSQSGMAALTQILEAAPDTRSGEVLRALEQAMAAGDSSRALDFFRQLARLDPPRAESLAGSPELAPMRAAVDQLLGQLTATAKLHAEGKLAEASAKLDTGVLQDESNPAIFVSVAGSLITAGGLTNYVRSAAVSEAAIDPARWAPSDSAGATSPKRAPLTALPSPSWLVAGAAAIALCWWLREDWLPIVCGACVGCFLVWLGVRRWFGSKY
jgi:hypothetical protein